MRILFLADNYPPETNAAASRVHERARYWVAWGHDVTVLTSAPNFPEGKVYAGYSNRWLHKETLDGVKVIRVKTLIAPNNGVKMRILDFMSFMVSATGFGTFMKRPDVVVATSPQFFCAVAGRALSGLKRVPFVFELSDLWPASIRAVGAMKSERVLKLIEKLELKLYRDATSIVALTNAFKEDLTSRGITANKISVIPNGVDACHTEERPYDFELAQALGLKDKFVVGYIGTHGLAHGLLNVIDAADLLREDDRIRFLFVGAGAQRDELMREAKQRNLTNVVFLPNKPKSEIGDFWRLVDVSLVHLKADPLFSTVLPSKIFESMAYGLPIIYCGPRGEAEELIQTERAGVCAAAGDSRDLASQVMRLIEDPILREKLAAHSKDAASRHTRERQAADMIAILERSAGLSPPRFAVARDADSARDGRPSRQGAPSGTSGS